MLSQSLSLQDQIVSDKCCQIALEKISKQTNKQTKKPKVSDSVQSKHLCGLMVLIVVWDSNYFFYSSENFGGKNLMSPNVNEPSKLQTVTSQKKKNINYAVA